MLLQSLVAYYEALAKKGEIDKPGWSQISVSYGLCLDENGKIDEVISLKRKTSDGKKEIPSAICLPISPKKSVNVLASFLNGKSSYILGCDLSEKSDKKTSGETRRKRDGNDLSDKTNRTKLANEACREKHLKILEGYEDAYSRSIKAFFARGTINAEEELKSAGCSQKMITEILKKGVNLVLMPLGKFPTDCEGICAAWDKEYRTAEEGKKGICLVTGKHDYIERLHPSIKNVVGAKSAGASLVAFNINNDAFESFGKKQGDNAPVGKYAAFAYTTALNRLVVDETHRIYVGDTTVLCWTEDAEATYQEIFTDVFGESNFISQKELYGIIKKLAQGLPVSQSGICLNPDNNFYILGISPNSARLSVRFFIRDSFGNVMKNYLLHNQQMEIVKPAFEKRERLTAWQIMRETVNSACQSDAVKHQVAGNVLTAILSGTRYPETLFYGIQNRISAERNITWAKASIIKAYLLRNCDSIIPKEEITVALNENSKNTAYNLGILFSNLEEIQDAANPGINTTIRDKYFTAVSSMPAKIFPLLIELAQSHIKKLGVRSSHYQKMLTETMSKLGEEFPLRLTLQEKGMFQLGYYHQTQKRYESKEEK